MTNNNTHHFNTLALFRQPDTTIEQLIPSSGHVLTDQRTKSGGAVRLPRLHTLDVDHNVDISRVPARQPLSPTAEWPIDPSTHKHSSLPSHIRNGTTDSKRPDTAINNQTTGESESRGVHHHPGGHPTSQEASERPLGGVRQDKDRFSSDRAASLQPAAVKEFTRSQATRRISPRSQKGDSDDRRCVPVQVWVSPLVKDELTRIASAERLSLSAAGAAFLTRALQTNVDMQYGTLLRPIIEDAIAKSMAGITTRLTWLLVRIAFDAGQTRSLVTNILGRQQGVTQPLLKTILEASARSAKGNIMRRTPQISELISSVEQWMREDNNRGERNTKTA